MTGISFEGLVLLPGLRAYVLVGVTDLGLLRCKDAHGLNVDETRRCVAVALRAPVAVRSAAGQPAANAEKPERAGRAS